MKARIKFKEQVQRNLVALISVFIAVSSLSYNTWRNEKSEYNRNQRMASFEVLLKLGELQQLVNHRHYEMDVKDKGNPKTGWALVLTIRDLSQVLEAPVPESSDVLVETWEDNFDKLGSGKEDGSILAIRADIETVRQNTLALLRDLD